MSIKKDIFAPLALGLGASVRRSAMLLLVMMLTTVTAWATTFSTINVGGTDYTLFTGFTATAGTEVDNAFVYGNMVDGDLSSSFHVFTSPAYVEFNTDEPIIPKGYIFNTYNASSFKPTSWVLKARADLGDDWTELDNLSGQSISGQEYSHSCNNEGNNAYKYFRFEVSNNSGNIWLTEIRLYDNMSYTHISVKAATCTETGIKQECWRRTDGKYFTDETGTTELAESDVIAPMIPHTAEHHAATSTNIEYWTCSVCGKYFSDETCTTEITEEGTKIYSAISYLDATGAQQSCTNYRTVENSSTVWNDAWYVVSSNTTITDRITVSGTVNLILVDGATLTASKGITVGSSATFNVYAQSDDEAPMGALVASGANDNQQYNAGIGGVDNTAAGTITINGGKINATGMVGAGIGSGGQSGATVGTITINGGIVTAQDGSGYGAGIGGGGLEGKASTINLNGGIINAAGIGSGYLGDNCSMTVNISDGVRKIVATPVRGGACIGKGASANGSVTVNFISGGNIVTGNDKDAVFYDTGEGSERQIRTKALNHTVTMSDDLKANITVNTEYAFAGETVTLTLGTAVDASTLKVNDGTSDLTLTDAGNRQYTFTMPAGNVTVTATLLQTYAVNLPASMEVVSATNAADANGKYISGTTITFKASFPYAASNVSDGTNTLEPDADGVYSVTIGTGDITVTATVGRSSTIDLTDASGDFAAINNDVLTGTTSHTVTIANGASITLNNAAISGSIVCEGTAEITLVGTNSVSNTWYSSAGIQIGGSGTTLTIKGDGSLTATGGSQAAGIGLGRTWDADATGGSIVIEGGTVTASGGNGIGTGTVGNSKTATVGDIIIKGGSVNARLGKGGIIGTGTANIGAIKIYDTIDKVDASAITESVTYMHVDGNTETDVTASASTYFTIIEDGDRRVITPKDDTDYTITIANNIEHGSIACAVTTAKYGDKVTITVTPDFGYRLSSLVVKDAQNKNVTSTGNTFTMPQSNVRVSAVFEQGVHGTTEFKWVYDTGGSEVEETIYDGVTTVNLQTVRSYYIRRYDEWESYDYLLIDNDKYQVSIPYSGGTGTFVQNGTSFNNDGDAGFYDITMTDVGNGKWSVSILKTVGKMDDIPDQTYTGSAITPEPLVLAGSLSLTKGTDYVYSYTNNTNVGTAKVTVTFKGDYASLGSVEKEFTITKATPTVTAPTPVEDLVYSGTAQALVTAGTTDFGTLIYSTDGTNYSADIPTGTAAGTYTVYYKVDGSDNWNAVDAQTVEVTIARTYTVTFDANGGEGTMEPMQLTYDGDWTALPANTFTRSGYGFKEWNTEADGSGTNYYDEEEVYNLTDEVNGNVVLYAQWGWDIAACDIRGTLEAYDDGYGPYYPLSNNLEVWNGDTKLTFETDYTIELDPNIGTYNYVVGEQYQATIKGTGDWGGTKTFTFTFVALHHTIVFDANGGTGTMDDATVANDGGNAGRYYLPECTFTAPLGKVFSHWVVYYEGIEEDPIKQPGDYFTAPYIWSEYDMQTITVTAYWRDALILLDDDSAQPEGSKNADIIAANEGTTGLTVQLQGRTLYKDGKWNTLCLPFDVSAAEIEANDKLSGCTLMTLDVTQKNGFDTEDGTLYLWFKTATAIEAGVPYLVKWTKAADYEGNEANYDIVSPVFEGVTISDAEAQAVESETAGLETVLMVGNYSPVSVTADDKSILFLGDANTLYYSTIDRQLRSCRAYFSVPYIKNNAAAAKIRVFALNFDGEEEATGILEVSSDYDERKNDAWYTLDGMRLGSKPTQRGMYINKGKKVIIK